VGREAELAEAAALLVGARLLTLTGPGGAGKTRLALELAAQLVERFSDGWTFVDLSPLHGGEFIWEEVASAAGVTNPGSGPRWSTAAINHMAPRQALVVLDNCEHVAASAAEVAAELLIAAPRLKIVATSREPLGVAGEVTWSVPPLSDQDGPALFTERARLARPNLSFGEKDMDAVRSICRRLDGLPLAIELAAARTRAFAPADIATGLGDRLDLLPAGPRTAPARQATLQASFDWSYELLSDAERALLRQCSVFVGGLDLEAALAVCPAGGLDVLGALVDRSLLLVHNESTLGAPRYRMLEPIRQFAAKRLADAGEVDSIRTLHRDHFLALAETAEPLLATADEDRWRARLTLEMDNMRAALSWSRESRDAESLARLVAALCQFWSWPGRMRELSAWLDAAADGFQQLSPRWRAVIRNRQCITPLVMPGAPRIEQVPVLSREALEQARASGDKEEEGLALLIQGTLLGLTTGAEAMRPYVEQGRPLIHQSRSSTFMGMGEALMLSVYSSLRLFQSGPEETRRVSEEAVSVALQRGDRHTRLFCSGFAGIVALTHGRLRDAFGLFDATVAGGRETNDSNYLHGLLGLAWIAMFRGDFAAANEAIAESRASARRAGTDSVSITSLEPLAAMLLGWTDLAQGDAAGAVEKLAQVVAVNRASRMANFGALPLTILAEAQLKMGERAEAAAFLDQSTALAARGKMTWILGRIARLRSEFRSAEGDITAAESLAHEALTLAREAGDQMGLVDALELRARLVSEQNSHKEAVRLWAAAESLRRELGYAVYPVDQAPRDAAIADARQALGPRDFGAAWAEGGRLSPDDVIAYVTRGRGARRRPSTGWASLTPSELEVARLVGQHLSNPEIATRLFISRATVKTHLVHIFAKLGIESRSELAVEASKRDAASRIEARREPV
jgi:predicted ATPase/DNA-binding CsgD family transcriptional regulator/tetratricopeptide (TPR) repeat protein